MGFVGQRMGGPIHPNPQCGHCVHFPTMFKIASLKLNGQDLVSAEWKRGLEGQLGQCGERQDAQLPVMVPSEPSIASSSEGQNLILHYIFIRKDLYHLLDHFGAAILTRGSLKIPVQLGK